MNVSLSCDTCAPITAGRPEDNFRQAAAPHAKRPRRQPSGRYSRGGQGRRRITGGMGMASALADVRTTHDAWPADEGYGYRDRRDYDEHEDPGDSAEYQINDLINTEVSLTHWTGPDAV